MLVGSGGAKEFDLEKFEDEETRKTLAAWADRMGKGLPFLESLENSKYVRFDLHNLHLSECYNCKEIAVWQYDKLSYPTTGTAPEPNPDLPADLKRDYDEASAILDISPRGAAALIRLVIQKLCRHLGQPGENINADIKALVAGGLDPRVQKALDAVRVIGNHAVHPGQIDLRDDRATAESLFRLLNLVVEKMVSEPKHVEEVYTRLPEAAIRAIEKRDGAKKAD